MIVEGIGDEVITVLATLFFTLLVTIIWKTTNVRERPPVRAVVIRSANSETIAELPIEQNRQIETRENELQEAVEATEASIQTSNSETNESASNVTEPEISNPDNSEDPVTIKVRFINEESLEIRERLSEKLGQFIAKHLNSHLELSTQDRVRLIYNGRVLATESTLAELGLTDNCVVHCLVQRQVNSATNETNTPNNDNYDDFDLSSFCFPLLGTLLLLMWFCQVVYAHYFNMASTLCLVTLSVLFLASAFNWLMVNEAI